jgi:pimeloyl-ACP methyl ester carboxylesterase
MTNPIVSAGHLASAQTAVPEVPAGATQIEAFPGAPVHLEIGDVFVRTAPAPPGAEPALFVHGLGGSALNWTDLMHLLGQPLPVNADAGHGTTGPVLAGEALDLPGFGYSPPPADGDYSIDARAAAVISLIDARANWPVHLIGNSLGGAVATRVAARRPDLVATLTLISPALPDLRPRLLPLRLAVVAMPGVGRWLVNKVSTIPAAERTDRSISELFADPSRFQPERREETIREVLRRDGLHYATDALLGSTRALVAEYTRPGPASLWHDAALVTAATLVLHGSHDRLVSPAMAGRAARAFSNGRVVVLPRLGHVAMMERPDLVAREMRAFIGAAATAPGGRGALSGAGR